MTFNYSHRLNGPTDYAYDELDRITRVVAPNGVVTNYTYDILGRRLTENSPDRGNMSYSYDLANNLTQTVDGRGVVTDYTYDELERVASKRFPANPAEDVVYTYDSCAFGLGYLCEVDDEAGSHNYEYDAFGNIVTMTKQELGQTYTTEYVYDDGDNIVQLTYPSGRILNVQRD